MEKKFELKPFDKVLVRDDDDDIWIVDLYGYRATLSAENYHQHCCLADSWNQCIPYEGNEHLLGTTDDYVEPYEPKDGDFVTFVAYVSQIRFTAICERCTNYTLYYHVGTIGRERDEIHLHNAYSLDSRDVVKPATEEEKQLLLSKLHEIGKFWNPEKKLVEDVWIPKDGDFLIADFGGHKWITVFKCYDGKNIRDHCSYSYSNHTVYTFSSWMDSTEFTSPLRLANDEEIELMLSKLHEAGKDWDAEKKEIVEYKWRPEFKEQYWSIIFDNEEWKFKASLFRWYNVKISKIHLDQNIVFKYKEDAEKEAEKRNELLLKGEK